VEQENLEERVSHIFERQGFEVEIDGNRFKAQGEQTEVSGTLFSSQRFEKHEVAEAAEGKVFVDEGLSGVADALEDVSVLESQDTGDIDMPSFEVIGDIAVINELEMPEDEAVDAILSHHDVKTILLKTEPLRGEFRVGEYNTLYGDETETIHRENGCRFKVDVTEAYFSERLATERQRVVSLVKSGEEVLVVGAGVGPFPIEIAVGAEPGGVVAVEKNSEAAEMMARNIERNPVGNAVKAMQKDVFEMNMEQKFDRCIFMIPGIERAFASLAAENMCAGATAHIYDFAEDPSSISIDHPDLEIKDISKCGERGPASTRYRIDLLKK
jgi:tRNA (guanine37-N1)-methyltransferase